MPERGHAVVDAATWAVLASAPAFWRLVDGKILAVTQGGPGRITLSGYAQVGRALVAGREIVVREKIPGALRALLEFASNRAFRVEQVASPATEIGPLIALLVEQFLKLVRSYASTGRQWEYARRREVGSLVGGRLDIVGTIRLRARGLTHLVSFDRNHVSFRTPLNRIVAAALLEVEGIHWQIGLPEDLLNASRSLSVLFEDCRDADVIYARRDRFVRTAEDLRDSEKTEERADMLALASALLSRTSFEESGAAGEEAPRSWFLNLETLFERAVRRTLCAICAPETEVLSGTKVSPPIFSGVETAYTAKPDIVLRRSAIRLAVGDVKYKDWSPNDGTTDLYQLLVHAGAFGVGTCFLVYPGDGFQVVDLGTASSHIRTRIFTVRVHALGDDLRSLLRELALPDDAVASTEQSAT